MRTYLVLSALVLLLSSRSALAIDPSLFPGYMSESLNVNVLIPEPNKIELVKLRPLLFIPEKPAPWSSIVLPSNCSGLDDQMWRMWIPTLLKEGIAVVLVDSFNPRGYSTLCPNQFLIPYGTRLQDVHQILDALRQDGRFKKDKIALGGHSTGASTAFQSSFAELQSHLGRDNDQNFNAFIAAAASCEVSFKNPQLSGPLLVIAAEKDDYTNPAPCKKEVERIKSDGGVADFVLISNAYHTFSTSGVFYSARAMRMPKEIPHIYIKKLRYVPRETIAELEDGSEAPFDALIRKHSGFLGSNIFGAHVGGNWDKAPEVGMLTVNFLKANGW
jgi:dienelactone hydrolase